MKQRIMAPLDMDESDWENIPIANLVNFGPVTSQELDAVGIKNFAQFMALGLEEVCRKWIEHYPERLNANAIIGVITTIDGTVWTKATSAQRLKAKNLVDLLRREVGLPLRDSNVRKKE